MKRISKNQKGFSAVELLIIVVVIGLIGGAGYAVYKNHHKTSTTVSSNANSATIISDVERALASKLNIESGTKNPTQAGTISITVASNVANTGTPQIVPGYNFSVSPNTEELSIKVYRTDNLSHNHDAVNIIWSVLSNEFKTLKPVTFYVEGQKSTDAYQNNVAICSYGGAPDYLNPTEVNCVDKSVYQTTAAIIKPLADALNAYDAANGLVAAVGANTGPGSYPTYGMPDIIQSKTPGYMTANMSVGEVGSYFYEKNGVWYFYEGNEWGLGCDFDNPDQSTSVNNDAQLAFLGQPCTNSPDGTTGTVQ